MTSFLGKLVFYINIRSLEERSADAAIATELKILAAAVKWPMSKLFSTRA